MIFKNPLAFKIRVFISVPFSLHLFMPHYAKFLRILSLFGISFSPTPTYICAAIIHP